MISLNLNLKEMKMANNEIEFSRSRNGRQIVISISHNPKKVTFKIISRNIVAYKEEVTWQTARKKLLETLTNPVNNILGRIKFARRFHFIPLTLAEQVYLFLVRKKGGVVFAR